ncbi:unnamed protein product, partial [Lymnaea stagnalis]
ETEPAYFSPFKFYPTYPSTPTPLDKDCEKLYLTNQDHTSSLSHYKPQTRYNDVPSNTEHLTNTARSYSCFDRCEPTTAKNSEGGKNLASSNTAGNHPGGVTGTGNAKPKSEITDDRDSKSSKSHGTGSVVPKQEPVSEPSGKST